MAIATKNMYCVDEDGVIVHELPKGSRIITPDEQMIIEQKKKQDDAKKILPHEKNQWFPVSTKTRGDFFVVLPDVGDIFCEKATTPTLNKLIYLATYINKDNILCTGVGGSLRPMTKKDIDTALSINKNALTKFWKECKENNFITEVDGKFYLPNDLFRFGKINDLNSKSTAMIKMFKYSVRFMYEKTDEHSRKMLGYIYRLLPFLNLNHNVLCLNPWESDLSKIQNLSLGDICQMFGLNYNDQKKFINRLKKLRFTDLEGVERSLITYSWEYGNKDIYWVKINPQLYASFLKEEDLRNVIDEFTVNNTKLIQHEVTVCG